jgi:hypothetical protein
MTFKKTIESEKHERILNGLEIAEPYPRHKIFKQHWQARFATWALSKNWFRMFKFLGAYILYFVTTYHFHIDWSIWEACLIGLGIGLYID